MLQIRSLKQMNVALLGKWLQKISDKLDALCKAVLSANVTSKEMDDGIHFAGARDSGIQKSIGRVDVPMQANIKYGAGNGMRLQFSTDCWMAYQFSKLQFPFLFNIDVRKDAMVGKYLGRAGIHSTRDLIFKRFWGQLAEDFSVQTSFS